MCSVMAGLTAIGGLLQYRQQREQGEAQAKMYEAQANAYRYQADAAEQNARIENKKQESIADKYAQEATELRRRRRLAEGEQRAQTGAAGLSFAGSSMDLLSASNEAYKEDQINLLTNQRYDNYASRIAESNYINQADQAHLSEANAHGNARTVRKAAKWQGIGTLIGTAASIVGMSGGGQSPYGTVSAKKDTISPFDFFDTQPMGPGKMDYLGNKGFDWRSNNEGIRSLGVKKEFRWR
ncbi:hypothetical protein TAMA11512_12870 [Selenomonas sp. TAMA-11512]|uniref:virion core protein, T7 gp14 family n=1 Tax=Selenomonas sp. TAMA-11512 TaxID=3095337 RepID=UPI00308DCEB1|nr:hypothetical protein TAMA11512_12870 [Selenomonas sp. TAMA-11512]